MDKAEAIKKIRQMSLPKETMEILETLIPELKESRDEQIRKAIIKSLDMPFPEDNLPGTDVTYKEAVDWLEKQNHNGKKWITPAELNRLLTLRYEAGFDDGVRSEMEKQKEQKPEQYDIDVLEKHITKDSISELAHTVIVRNGWEIVEKEQKPAEWGEEDKSHLASIIGCIELCKKDSTEQELSIYDSEIAWLKSLRPSWKPSEEQMEALLWCTAHLGGADHRVLAELYEHLKMYCL